MRFFLPMLAAFVISACPTAPPPIVGVEGEGEEGEGEGEGEGAEGDGEGEGEDGANEGEGEEGEGEEGEGEEGEGEPPPLPDTVLITNADAFGFCQPCQVQLDRTLQLSAFAFIGGAQSQTPPLWSVDDENIASVDDTGLVRGRAAGTVTVSADVEGVVGTAEIEVVDGPTPARMVVSPEQLPLTVGQTANVNVQVFDADDNLMEDVEVTFQCLPEDIATIDTAGLVTAVAAGDAFVLAQAGSLSGNVAVTVTE